MFAGKVAIVTGGTSGIGAALAARLRGEGAKVVVADIAPAPGDRLLDVRDRAGFAAIVAEVVDEHGRLDLLFNNAGISPGGRTHELDPAV